MHKEFIAYENLERKSEFFRKELPDDTRLHRLYRRVDFMEKVDNFKEQKLNIEDQIIDTESNLWYIVLQDFEVLRTDFKEYQFILSIHEEDFSDYIRYSVKGF